MSALDWQAWKSWVVGALAQASIGMSEHGSKACGIAGVLHGHNNEAEIQVF